MNFRHVDFEIWDTGVWDLGEKSGLVVHIWEMLIGR